MLRTRPRPSRTLAVALAAAVPLAVPAVASAAPTTMAAATSEDAFRGEVSATGVRRRAHTV